MLIPLPVLESVLEGTDRPFLRNAASANLRCALALVRNHVGDRIKKSPFADKGHT